MSLKKRMFRSNMAMIFSSLVALILVVAVVLGIFEDSFERQMETIGDSKVEIRMVEKDGTIVKDNVEVKDYLKTTVRESFLTLIAAVLFIGGGTIFLLLILAGFFTRKMTRVVMEPLDQLVDGAKRIQSGELTKAIEYSGEEEFEKVCQAFNSMQDTILEDQRQREKNERARTDMVTGISHDLRTPLTAIRGYIKGVLDGVASTKERQTMYLETAYEATDEMNILLQKLFDFSRMESGQLPFHFVKVDLGEYAAAYVAQKESVMDPEKVQFEFYTEEGLPEISMDVEQVRRIFDNFLENSMKYAGMVPVRINVKVQKTKEGIALEWKDNGEGVPEEKLGHIFERFYRCDEARTQKGSGVGLYVVKYIMERHGGDVTAENDNGLKLKLNFKAEDEHGEDSDRRR